MNTGLRIFPIMMENSTKAENLRNAHFEIRIYTIYREDRNLESRLIKPENILQNMGESMFMTATFVSPITVYQRATG